jgi:hypothetical protein
MFIGASGCCSQTRARRAACHHSRRDSPNPARHIKMLIAAGRRQFMNRIVNLLLIETQAAR